MTVEKKPIEGTVYDFRENHLLRLRDLVVLYSSSFNLVAFVQNKRNLQVTQKNLFLGVRWIRIVHLDC
jgi:hypothetical protein